MSVLEVTSELYSEAEFCSTETGNGSEYDGFFLHRKITACACASKFSTPPKARLLLLAFC